MPSKISPAVIRVGELLSYCTGILLTLFFIAQLAQGEARRREDVSAFNKMATPDTRLWAPGRLASYQASMQMEVPAVLGVLEVPSVGLQVPVYPSDSELNLDRGAGVVDGMAYPHEAGNIGIAGHRDGYFRVLKDISVGDRILLSTLEGSKQFTIESRKVVEVDDLSSLRDTQEQTLTLITCYPFYFVGNAPQRFIVTASLDTNDVNQQ